MRCQCVNLWFVIFGELKMDSQKFIIPVLAFISTFSVGLFAVACVGNSVLEMRQVTADKPLRQNSGISSGDRGKSEFDVPVRTKERSGLRILSKPKPQYTDEARDTFTTGKVVLKVELLASGKIGEIEVINGLPKGLTERAIEAAKGIRFTPLMEDGKPVTVKRSVEYTFTIF